MRHMRSAIFLTGGILVAVIILMIFGHARAAATLIVPDEFATIQAAINAANPGDTIMVRSGTYLENLMLNKSVVLTAESYDPIDPTHNAVIIDSGATNLVDTINVPLGISPMPTIRGFVIRNGNNGISAFSEIIVEYNYFISGVDQVDYSKGSGGINRYNVYFASVDDAIDMDSPIRPLLFENNRVMYSGNDGIEIRLQDTSAPAQPIEITIRKNELIGAKEDGIQLIDYGQAVDTNRRLIINNNLIANSRMVGIGLMPDQNTTEDYSGADMVEAVRVYNNTFYGNNYGISGGDNLVAFNNIVANSITKGVWRVQGPVGANSVVAQTLFYNNGVDTDQSSLGTGNLFGQNPRFASPPSAGPDGLWGTIDDDFSGLAPLSDSPAIDAGITQYIANTGEAIPASPISGFNGNAPDLGWKEYDPFAPPTATPTASSTPTPTPVGFNLITSQVTASSDDAEEAVTSGSMSISSSDLELGADGTTSQWVGMRFNNISVPRGAFIVNAYVEFGVDETGSDPTSITFQGQATDNAGAFSSSSYNISNRSRTNTQVVWNTIPAWTILNARWQTPDLASIIKEIVDRPSWASGNSIVIVAKGTGRRTAKAYDGEVSAAPKLVIQYTTGNTPTPSSTPSATSVLTATVTPTLTSTPTSSGSGVNDEVHWTITGPNSISIDWRGPSNTISYGATTAYGQTVTGSPPSPMPFSSSGPFWEAKLTNLQPNTTYHYSIGDGPDHTFKTALSKGSSGFTVDVIGDVGDTINYPNVGPIQAMIAADQPRMVLLVGDLTYGNDHGPNAVDQHFNDVQAWSLGSTAYMPAWGNHEWYYEANDNLNNYKGRFDFPNPQISPGSPTISCCGEDWYYFDFGNTRFIAYPEPWGGAWSDWNTRAAALMDEAQADPTITFIVTFGHRPAYSSGYNPSENSLQGYLNNLGSTHSKYVLNLNGHSHNYERTFPQSNVVHITAGTGGADLEEVGACLWSICTQPSWSAQRYMHQGVVRLTFNANSIQGAFICGPSGGGINDITCNQGDVIDTFVINNDIMTATPTLTPGGLVNISSQVANSAEDAEEEVSNGSVSLTSSDLELGADGTVAQWVGMRFNNISVPRGASIVNAYVEFEVDETGSDPTSVTIQGQAADNASAFSTGKYDISSRLRTNAQVAWNDIPAWTLVNAKWQTPNLASIVQEIVARPGWVSGNSMAIIVSGSGRRTAEAYDGEIPAAPKLVIQYTTGATSTPTATWTPTPTFTSTPTETGTPIQTSTPTDTATPSQTPTDTATPTLTATASPSLTPTLTYTATETGTSTLTPTSTFTSTLTSSPTFTSTSTETATPTPSPTKTSTPTASPTPADVIFSDGFESGNLSAWSSSITDAGDLYVNSAAALIGNYGMLAIVDDNNSIYVTDDGPNAETRYRARFYFDPNTIIMANNDAHYIFQGYTGTSIVVLRIELRFSKGAYQLRAILRNDSNSWANSNWFTVSDIAHYIEMDWRASSASGANNGGLTLWIDGSQRATLTGVDNDTRRIDLIQLGAVSGVDSGTRGIYYFDQFESRRQTYIGPYK